MTKQQLQFKLDHGEIVIFKDPEDNKYMAIGSAGKDEEGDYRTSGWYTHIKYCLQMLGKEVGYYQKDLEENLKSWKYIKSIPPKYNLVPVGTKVRILENAKEECEKFSIQFLISMQKMIGNVYEIIDIKYSDYIIKGFLFPRSAFVIAECEEEVEEETIMIKNGKQYKVKIIEEIK